MQLSNLQLTHCRIFYRAIKNPISLYCFKEGCFIVAAAWEVSVSNRHFTCILGRQQHTTDGKWSHFARSRSWHHVQILCPPGPHGAWAVLGKPRRAFLLAQWQLARRPGRTALANGSVWQISFPAGREREAETFLFIEDTEKRGISCFFKFLYIFFWASWGLGLCSEDM